MKTWFTKFISAVFANGLTSTATLVSGILILRLLNEYEAGRFTLLYSTGSLVTTFGTLGQVGLLNRIYARSAVPHDWRRDFLNTALICFVLTAVSALVFSEMYGLFIFELIYLFVYAFTNILSNASGSMLNSQGYYTWAGLLYRLQNALFIFPVLMMMAGWIDATLFIALTSLLMIGVLCDYLGWVLLKQYMPDGEKIIKFSDRSESISLNLNLMAHSALDPGLVVVAGYFIKGIELAALGGILAFFRPAVLVWFTMMQTLTVEFAREQRFGKRKIFQAILFLTPPLVLISWMAMPWLLHVIYDGKYDLISAASLPVALMIGLLILETIPRSYMNGKANTRLLHIFSLRSVLFAGISICVEILFIRSLGVMGVAWAGVFILLGRNLLGYIMLLQNRHQPNNSA